MGPIEPMEELKTSFLNVLKEGGIDIKPEIVGFLIDKIKVENVNELALGDLGRYKDYEYDAIEAARDLARTLVEISRSENRNNIEERDIILALRKVKRSCGIYPWCDPDEFIKD